MVLSVFWSSATYIFAFFDLKNIHKTSSFYVKHKKVSHMGLKMIVSYSDFWTNYTFNWAATQ